jgi:hypothetical protein
LFGGVEPDGNRRPPLDGDLPGRGFAAAEERMDRKKIRTRFGV